MAADPREPQSLGEVLHRARQAGGEQRPRPWPVENWADRDPRLKALDEAMAAAVEVEVRERLAARMDELAAYYPESVWPPDSDVRDSIGATAMRHAYMNAAREIREGQPAPEEPTP